MLLPTKSMDSLGVRLERLVADGRVYEAFNLLHEACTGDVLRFVRRHGPAEDARDLCQDVWAAAFRSLPRYRFEAEPRAWLLGIAEHKIADAQRRLRQQKLVPFSDPDGSSGRLLERVLGRQPTPSSQLRRKRRDQALARALGELDPFDRKLVELRFYFDLKPSEIVEALSLGMPPNTVSQRLARALQKLRRSLLLSEEFRPH